MIYGIGVDIIKIERIKKVIERWGGKFLKRVFTENEIKYCYKNKSPYCSFAVRFAAKEAFIKSLGDNKGIALSEIEVENNSNGKPFLRFKGKTEEILKEIPINNVYLSLSHENDYGVAVVILEK